MRMCNFDGNLELLRMAFGELYSREEIDHKMWEEIIDMGQARDTLALIDSLKNYDKIRCMYDSSEGEFGITEEFFDGNSWFADGVTANGTIGCLIGDDTYCLVKGYDKNFSLFTVSYLDDRDVPDVTVPAIVEKPGDFIVGVPSLVGMYKYAVLIMKKQEGN